MTSMLKLERDRTTENMESQMKDMQEESEKMIQKLEKAVLALKTEKIELSNNLEEINRKCEDTEDALYDAQKEQKKKDMENSLAIWKSMTNMFRMRQRFQVGMQKFDEEAAEQLAKVQKKATSKLDQMTLSAMQFSGTLAKVEKSRAVMYDALVNYKTDMLIEKRTQIRMIEKDVERLTQERDSLEETRETMEEETAGLEAQVRELEEQIREHNRSSSMTNGRINVAHARKKRRLDSELERILELIEQRRIQVVDLDEKVAEKGRARDEKESRMIDLEKDLVGVLLEQQKKVLSLVEDASFEEQNRTLATVAGIPWPPMLNASIGVVRNMRREQEARENTDKAERERQGLDSDDENAVNGEDED
jgi:predicted  nucleic acid-binding Zn-ribbon protein